MLGGVRSDIFVAGPGLTRLRGVVGIAFLGRMRVSRVETLHTRAGVRRWLWGRFVDGHGNLLFGDSNRSQRPTVAPGQTRAQSLIRCPSRTRPDLPKVAPCWPT